MKDARRILKALKQKGWTDEAIGDALGASRVTVCNWRNGAHPAAHPEILEVALRALLDKPTPVRSAAGRPTRVRG